MDDTYTYLDGCGTLAIFWGWCHLKCRDQMVDCQLATGRLSANCHPKLKSINIKGFMQDGNNKYRFNSFYITVVEYRSMHGLIIS